MNRIKKIVVKKAKSVLTKRQWEIFVLLEKGLSSQDMAELLCRSRYTIDNHRGDMLERTGAKNTAELIAMVRDWEK